MGVLVSDTFKIMIFDSLKNSKKYPKSRNYLCKAYDNFLSVIFFIVNCTCLMKEIISLLYYFKNSIALKMAEKMGCYHIVDLSTPTESSHNKTPSVFMVSSNSGCMETLCPARWIDLLEICRNRPTRSDRILYGSKITVCLKVFKNFMEKLSFFSKKILRIL